MPQPVGMENEQIPVDDEQAAGDAIAGPLLLFAATGAMPAFFFLA